MFVFFDLYLYRILKLTIAQIISGTKEYQDY